VRLGRERGRSIRRLLPTVVMTAGLTWGAVPAEAQVLPTCQASTVSITQSANSYAVSGGHDGDVFLVRNDATTACTLDGYPTVTPVNGADQPLPAQQSRYPANFGPFVVPAATPQLVTLAPGESAWFVISTFVQPAAPAAGLSVSLPGMAGSKLVDSRGFDYDGALSVTAIEPASPPDLVDTVLPAPAVAATVDGNGFVVEWDGAVADTSGDAANQGSVNSDDLNAPVVGIATDPATGGCWMVGADGGVFAFGAPCYGSTGNLQLNQPIVGIAATPDGGG
jgi:Protein of unknown function (DUF4232)